MEWLPPLECLYRDELWAHERNIWSPVGSHGLAACRQVENNRRWAALPCAHVYGLTTAIIGTCLQDAKSHASRRRIFLYNPSECAPAGVGIRRQV